MNEEHREILRNNTGKLKLTSEQAQDLTDKYEDGIPQTKLSEEYDISVQTVRNYLRKAGLLPMQQKVKKQVEQEKQKIGLIGDNKLQIECSNGNSIPSMGSQNIQCEDKKQTYRKNLSWAIQAAGQYSRTGSFPTTCPNDTAFFLLRQAIDQPKDFMAKVTQVEGRNLGEEDAAAALEKNAKLSIADIEEQLQDLD